MEHTTNYQLSQWESTDRIMMSDFNADNAKIDAALKTQAEAISALGAQLDAKADQDDLTALANRSRFTKLKEFTSTEASSFLQIYLNDIDWTQWDKIHVDVKAAGGGSYFFYVTDTQTPTEHIGSISCGGSDGNWAPRITFHVGFRADRTLNITCAGNSKTGSATYAQLVKMAFSGSIMPAGAYYVFWGEK